MEVKTDLNFYGLEDMAWSGAKDTLKAIREAGKEDELMQFLEEMFWDKTPTDTEVNDFLWFESSYIYENLGLNEDAEEMSSLDEARRDGTTWGVDVDDIKSMEESGLFETCFIDYLKEEVKESYSNIYYFDVDELDMHSEKAITADQVDFLNDNF